MPRFSDQWVVDRTLFEFVSGGSCACCGFSHLFHPEGLKGVINDISDLETDAADAEYSAAIRSPWPPDMRDQVWADRVRLRHKMKKEMGEYRSFLTEAGGVEGLRAWCRTELGPSGLRRLLQMPRSEISDRLGNRYGIHSAFAVVLCAVSEQVANYGDTGYPPDGRGAEELAFESLLRFDRRGGYVLPVVGRDPETGKFTSIDDGALDVFVDLLKSLGGAKLLHRAPKKVSPEGGQGSDDEAEVDSEVVQGQTGPSFRSDRRVVRLLIARYWADQIMIKYETYKEKERAAEEKDKEEDEGKKKEDPAVEGDISSETAELATKMEDLGAS